MIKLVRLMAKGCMLLTAMTQPQVYSVLAVRVLTTAVAKCRVERAVRSHRCIVHIVTMKVYRPADRQQSKFLLRHEEAPISCQVQKGACTYAPVFAAAS